MVHGGGRAEWTPDGLEDGEGDEEKRDDGDGAEDGVSARPDRVPLPLQTWDECGPLSTRDCTPVPSLPAVRSVRNVIYEGH